MNENLPTELDFISEGHNAERAGEVLLPGNRSTRCVSVLSSCFGRLGNLLGLDVIHFRVPRIFWETSTKRVLVMEFCEGCPINDVEGLSKQGIHPLLISKALGDLYGKLIFESGFIHADPHPGNVVVHLTEDLDGDCQNDSATESRCSPLLEIQRHRSPVRKVKFSLLDHGLYCTIDREFREHYALLWKGLLTGDIDAMKENAGFFGVPEHLRGLLGCIISSRTEESIGKGVQSTAKTVDEVELLKSRVPEYFAEITQVLQHIPKQFVLILKTNDLVRSIQRSLGLREELALIPLSRLSLRVTADREMRSCVTALQRWWTFVKYWVSDARLIVLEWFLMMQSLREFALSSSA
eukprot:GHVQ01015137.1.p1 GENE.GHVQ01015137.1~~GHVQ01015137.1.p1  ORF type:complete len:352 (+),score=23.54 GHVQ01015137.1:950-2005(+)